MTNLEQCMWKNITENHKSSIQNPSENIIECLNCYGNNKLCDRYMVDYSIEVGK